MRKALATKPALPERERVHRIVQAAQDTKALDIVLYDMEQRSSITDYVMICSGRSQAHVRGIAEKIETELRHLGVHCQSSEGYQEGSWVLLDYDVAIVHVFHPETRTYYDLESLLSSFPHERFAGDSTGVAQD
jgi:ribosome-associated protein